jgi:hypothetical protein
MKTTLVLVLNLPLMILPAACSRRIPSAEGAEAFGEVVEDAGDSGQAAGRKAEAALESADGSHSAQADSGPETLQQRVRQMKSPQLLEIARECRLRLKEAEKAIKPLTRRMEAIPLTDRLSPEAQKFSAELVKLKKSQEALSKELEIYTTALKAYGVALEE